MADTISFTQSLPPVTDDQGLWVAIRNRTEAITFERYSAFITEIFCGEPEPQVACGRVRELVDSRDVLERIGQGTRSYDALRTATELFLMLNAGVYVHSGSSTPPVPNPNGDPQSEPDACGVSPGCRAAGNLGSELLLDDSSGSVSQEDARLPNRENPATVAELKSLLSNYLTGSTAALPYIDRVISKLYTEPQDNIAGTALCEGLLSPRVNCPMFLELIWSYWLESAGTVQTLKAIALRFQNRRVDGARDPLAGMDIAPLFGLTNILWGYIQDEPRRLTVLRRVYEYDHHYGISLHGKAIPELNSVDSRSKFLESFHHLLQVAVAYFRSASDATKVPDGFPLLHALKEVHLILAEGAGNQFGDLPWQARVEMMIEHFILGRPEMRQFLGGRAMVPYPADRMGRVDTMRKIQSWGDTSVRHFYDLAAFGEQLLLSCRYGDWSAAFDESQAQNWAIYFKAAIQGYVQAYRSVTGVDLSNPNADPDTVARMRMSPADLISSTQR